VPFAGLRHLHASEIQRVVRCAPTRLIERGHASPRCHCDCRTRVISVSGWGDANACARRTQRQNRTRHQEDDRRDPNGRYHEYCRGWHQEQRGVGGAVRATVKTQSPTLRARVSHPGKLTCQRCGTARDCPGFFALSAAPQGPDRDDLGDGVDACAVTERARRWPGDRLTESRFKRHCCVPLGCTRDRSMMWSALSKQKDHARQCCAGCDSRGNRDGALLDVPIMFNTFRHPSGPAFIRGARHRGRFDEIGLHGLSVPTCVGHRCSRLHIIQRELVPSTSGVGYSVPCRSSQSRI
jgi:hypothetical protein